MPVDSFLPVFLLVMTLFGVGGLAWWLRRREWVAAAREHGLTYRGDARELEHQLVGDLGGCQLVLRAVDGAPLRAELSDTELPDLSIARQRGHHTLVHRVSGTPDVQLGDADTDDVLLLSGDRDWLLALLEPALRQAVAERRVRVSVQQGTLRLDQPETGAAAIPVLLGLATRLVELSRRGVEAALTDRLDDPQPGLRRTAMAALLQHPADVADRAATRCLSAADALLRVRAMVHLGIGGDALGVAVDRDAEPAARVEALQGLLAAGAPTRDAFDAVLATAPAAQLQRTLELVRTHGLLEHLDQAVALLQARQPSAVRIACLGVLGAHGTRAHAPALRLTLEDPSRPVRAAAQAALDQLTERHDLGQGGLSLAEAPGGGLSEVDGETGGADPATGRATR